MLGVVCCVYVAARTDSKKDELSNIQKSILTPNYPTVIATFPVRLNPYNLSESVSRGRFDIIGGFPYNKDSLKLKVSTKQFKEALQCSESEPALDEFYGTLSLLELYPPTREVVELFCLWAETRCYDAHGNWSGCKKLLEEYRKGNYPKEFGMLKHNMFESFRLLRIMNGTLYYDWPWGIDRVPKLERFGMIYDPLLFALNAISDVKDSIFGFGGEHIAMPWKLPFPLIAEVSYTLMPVLALFIIYLLWLFPCISQSGWSLCRKFSRY